jgi:hypothetical protein
VTRGKRKMDMDKFAKRDVRRAACLAWNALMDEVDEDTPQGHEARRTVEFLLKTAGFKLNDVRAILEWSLETGEKLEEALTAWEEVH